MWVYQEQVDGKNLTEIINEKHENVKCAPRSHLCPSQSSHVTAAAHTYGLTGAR